MDRCLRLIVYRGNAIYDSVIVEPHRVFRCDRIGGCVEKSTGSNGDARRQYVTKPIRLCTRGLISYLVSAYVVVLSNSRIYRTSALRMLFGWLHARSLDKERTPTIFIRLGTPKKQFLDYKW